MCQIKVEHHQGRHCSSTGLCNLLNFHGIPWTEVMCVGIGAGLEIWYAGIPNMARSRLLHVRCADFEDRFFRNIDYPFKWKRHTDPLKSEKELCSLLNRGILTLLQTDIYFLPYFNSDVHFEGHVITVWGYDEKKKVFFVTDTERKDVLEVPFDKMRKARFWKGVYLDIQGNIFAPEKLYVPNNMEKTIRRAIKTNSSALMDDSSEEKGICALKKWRSEIPEWEHFKDWEWTARFFYQVIEKRGTGGCGFRLMYAEFLKEAEDYLPEIASRGLAKRMFEVSSAWEELAITLKNASKAKKADFSETRDKLLKVEKLETAYHKEALSL